MALPPRRHGGSRATAAPGLARGDWPDSLDGRPGGAPWTRVARRRWPPSRWSCPGRSAAWSCAGTATTTRRRWSSWRSGPGGRCSPSRRPAARRGPNALTGYQYLLASPEFMAAHRPEVIVSAGRPGLTRPQSALLGLGQRCRRGRSGTSSSRRDPACGPTRSAPRPTSRRGPADRGAGPGRVAPGAAAGAARHGGRWLDDWRRRRTRRRSGRRRRRRRLAGTATTRVGRQRAVGAEVARELRRRAAGERAAVVRELSLSVRDIDLLMPPRGGHPRDREQGRQRDRRDRSPRPPARRSRTRRRTRARWRSR